MPGAEWFQTHWVAVVLLAAYTALMIYHAWVGKRETRSLGDYYVGGRGMGGLLIGVSFFATYASTNSYIGHAGMGYAYGLPWLIMAALIVVFTGLSWVVIAPRLRLFTASWESLTVPDYLERRFAAQGPTLRVASGVVILVSSILYLVAIYKGAGTLFEVFLGIDYTSAVLLTLLIVMGYTAIGGFVSVVRTDFLQGLFMLVGSVTIFVCITSAAGGVDQLPELATRPDTAHLFTWNAGIPLVVLIGIALSGSLKLLVDPRQVSRFYALRDERSVRTGFWVAVIGIAIIQFSLFPVGIYTRFLLDGVTDTDLIMPTLLNDPSVFPVWVADFLLVAMIAAAMSSMDSVLLVAGTVFHRDLVGIIRPATDAMSWTRWAVVGIAVVSAWIALRPPGGIVEITIFSGSLYAVCFLPAILLGLHWRKGTARAVLASMLVGTVVLLAWLLTGLGDVLHEVFPALAASCLTYVIIALNSPPALDRWPTPAAQA